MPDPQVSVWIRAKDTASNVVKKFERGLQSVRKVAGTVAKGVVAITAAAAAAIVAIGKLAQKGGEFTGLRNAFNRTFGDGTAALNMFREATRGLIPDMELMRNANQALALGAADSAEGFADLARLAQDLDRALGLQGQGLEKLTVAIARQSILRADDLGITLSAEEASRKYAEQLGREVSSLTASEKKIAFRTEVLRRGNELVEQMGVSELEAADAVDRASTAFSNFTSQVGVLVSKSPIVADFFDKIADIGEDIVTALESDSETIRAAFEALGGIAGNTFVAAFFASIGTALNTIDRALLPKIFGIEKKLATLIGVFGEAAMFNADAALQAADAWAEALSAAARAGSAAAAAGGAGGGGGGSGGGAGGGGLPAAVGGAVFRRGLVPNLFRPRLPFGAIGLAANATRSSPFSIGGGGGQVPSIFADARRHLRPLHEAVNDAGDDLQDAGAIVVGEFGRMADAAVSGSGQMASVVTSALSNIIGSLKTSGGGLFGATLPGAIIGAGLGILGGLFGRSGRNREPVRVHLSDVEQAAARKLAQANQERPVQVHVTHVTPEGRTIEEVEHLLKNRAARDGVQRRFVGGL